MSIPRALIFALFGLAFGSFLSVVVYRVPRKRSIVAPRSACPACGAEIRPRDNIPVLSYIVLRGRCRACGARISPRYLFLEVATALLFAGASLRFDRSYVAGVIALFLWVMLAVTVIDIEHRIIPHRIMDPAQVGFAVLVTIGALTGQAMSLARAGLGLLGYGGFLLIVHLVSPKGMGFGDVRLSALIGMVLGALGFWYVLVAVMLAFLAGGFVGVALMTFAVGRAAIREPNPGAGEGRRTAVLTALHDSRKSKIPFGPYLAAGAMAAVFLAPRIASWYSVTPR